LLAQLIGAVLAAALIRYVYPPDVPSTAGLPALSDNIDLLKGIVVEAGATMVLLVAVFGTAVDNRAAKIGGLAIGLALAAGILMAGPLTGGALNPARWFGPAVVAGDFSNALVWIIGPLLGASIIAVIYRFLILPEAEGQEKETDSAS
jgi:glycerol uptake facilitator-like aquaporin